MLDVVTELTLFINMEKPSAIIMNNEEVKYNEINDDKVG